MATKIINHPLIKAKMTILRNKKTPTNTFRDILEEITAFLAYEAYKNIDLKEVSVDTPLAENAKGYKLKDEIVVVPIFRAGLGMLNGIRKLTPNIKEGHIGIYRDEESLKPIIYYNKLPKQIVGSFAIILDPMLATGATLYDSIIEIQKKNPKKITILSIVASPEGIKKIEDSFPEVDIIVAQLDEKLTKGGYIYPGLGDAGDRIFGTK